MLSVLNFSVSMLVFLIPKSLFAIDIVIEIVAHISN